jgi:hypothetical protein
MIALACMGYGLLLCRLPSLKSGAPNGSDTVRYDLELKQATLDAAIYIRTLEHQNRDNGRATSTACEDP